jgi:hypothetical protein
MTRTVVAGHGRNWRTARASPGPGPPLVDPDRPDTAPARAGQPASGPAHGQHHWQEPLSFNLKLSDNRPARASSAPAASGSERELHHAERRFGRRRVTHPGKCETDSAAGQGPRPTHAPWGRRRTHPHLSGPTGT